MNRAEVPTAVPFAVVVFAAVCAFGAVHEPARLALVVVLCSMALYEAGRGLRLIRPVLLVLTIGCLAGGLSALTFMPVGPQLRGALQPGYGPLVNEVLSLLSLDRYPLALDPWRGAVEWALSLAVLLWVVVLARTPRRWGGANSVLLAMGLTVVVTAAVQSLVGATSIYGSGIPETVREPFFGPFVNANHGGILLAMLVPLALEKAQRLSGIGRLVSLLVALTLAGAVVETASRGAVVALAVAVATYGLFLLPTGRALAASALAAVLGAGAIALRGPAILERLTRVVDPVTLTVVEGGWADLYGDRPELLSDVWSMVGAAPLVGTGHAGFDDAYALFKSGPTFYSLGHAHCEPLQLLVEHGWLVLGC